MYIPGTAVLLIPLFCHTSPTPASVRIRAGCLVGVIKYEKVTVPKKIQKSSPKQILKFTNKYRCNFIVSIFFPFFGGGRGGGTIDKSFSPPALRLSSCFLSSIFLCDARRRPRRTHYSRAYLPGSSPDARAARVCSRPKKSDRH